VPVLSKFFGIGCFSLTCWAGLKTSGWAVGARDIRLLIPAHPGYGRKLAPVAQAGGTGRQRS